MKVFEKNSNIFKLLSEAVSEGIIVVNEKQKIVEANGSANAMFGYEPGELVGKHLNTLIPAQYHQAHKKHIETFMHNSGKRQMGHGRDLFGIKKNGTQFPVEAGLNPFEIYGNKLVMALVTDISERKENERSYKIKSEALQSTTNGIIITDARQKDNPIIYFNPAFQELTGYNEEEILNQNCRFLQADDRDQKSVALMRKAVREGKSCHVVLRNYRKDGSLFWNDLHITPIKDANGTVSHYIGIQLDVTKRKEAEEELNHWFQIFDESLNEIYVFDAHSLKFINVNYGAQKNIGYTLEELKKMTPLDIKPNFTEASFREAIKPLTNNEVEKLQFETTHTRKDGTSYPVEVHLQLSTIGDREMLVAIILDITERKEYTEELEKKVKERTLQLTEALNKEKELNDLKTKFLSLVSHEFKTPLSGILTSTTLAGRYIHTEQQEKREKHYNTIKNKVKYLNNILNDFLSVERLESGKVNYKFNNFPISKVINEVIYDANMLLKNGQRINYPANIDDIFIDFDEKILELILTNLTSNAIKYSPEDTTIDINVVKKEKELYIEVKDQGMGIPAEEQKHIFNRYFRAENALLNQGTGIGLNIVKSHLENLGGEISFVSAENEGSTFTIKFPV
ncbi:sensor histidine kinase [Gillisia lutea]|nr:PAS domain S-box protein [Gillisia lutea]